MGYGSYHQAIPLESGLFRRIRDDRRAAILLGHLFTGSRPLDLRENADELEDLVEFVVGSEEGFRSSEDVRSCWLDLVGEIDRAEGESPGLLSRHAFLYKNVDEIERALIEALEAERLDEARPLVESLLFGEEGFPDITYRRARGVFGIVWPATVAAGADLLGEIDPASLDFGHPLRDEDIRLDYRIWLDLYREAGLRGDAVLIRGE